MSRHALFEMGPTQTAVGAGSTIIGAATRILVYGDSLTAGYPDYAPYAKALIDTCASVGMELTVVGCGLCGFTANDMRRHLHSRGVKDSCRRVGIGLVKLLEDESADNGPFSLVLLMAGTNDILEGTSSPEQIASDITSLHEACHKYGVHTALLSIPDLGRERDHTQRVLRRLVNDQLKEWACGPAGRLTHFVDSAELLPYDDSALACDAWESDGIHFSETGSDMFGTALAPQLLHWLRPGLASQLSSGERLRHGMDLNHNGQAEQEDAASSSLVSPGPRRVLVLGGAVALGAGASPGKGWVDCFGLAVQAHGFEVNNDAMEDSSLKTWQERLCSLGEEHFEGYSVVVMSISPTDGEDLLESQLPDGAKDIEARFCDGLELITFLLRGKMRRGARLVVAGPRPHEGHTEAHLPLLERVLGAIRKFEEVDYVIDFLKPSCHDGHGRWASRAMGSDAGFPSDFGHQSMYDCIDVPAVLGIA
mmetsp:Transcript_117724/g.333096  ORF Transcript_117724/g.333096 Transcript_117724/m.333096 type:complete len:479 (+) Transcript_117724:60-1496(+)